ncbi:MAG TPA: hypothetical protein VEH27_20260 [Methylomirabilota bacterium]|nr:hypothetical protein [Methylomirabilota bacterium]
MNAAAIWFRLSTSLALGVASLVLAGCATSTIESRRSERMSSYMSLAPDEKQLVDTGQIRMGMTQDAVYISWGQPAEVLEGEDETGRYQIWRYVGSWMQESRYWAYREVGSGPDLYLERYLLSDYQPRDYVRAEIVFQEGKVKRWRTLPRPAY